MRVDRSFREERTPVGIGDSRLLREDREEHEAAEAEAARLFRVKPALFLRGRYAAQSAVLTTLPQRGDLVVVDSLVRASIQKWRAQGAEFRTNVPNEPQSVEDSRVAGFGQNGLRLGSCSKFSTAWMAVSRRWTS
ncbi:hypothetical protein [Bradyrhizobium sp. 151]|uniref:hypothetical protein n=1 Tax=Bradyrhizobium sp. 151 TaxID=2782626 RepID=UPI001FF8FD5A|nr:hypothetical protein [Bradyrhizobium sp. 151]